MVKGSLSLGPPEISPGDLDVTESVSLDSEIFHRGIMV